MDDAPRTDGRSGSADNRRLIQQADRMAQSGRITPDEAARIQDASSSGETEQVVRDIRLRHAGSRIAAAVAEGDMSQEAADGFLEQIRNGEHPRGLRAHLAQLSSRRRKQSSDGERSGPSVDNDEVSPK